MTITSIRKLSGVLVFVLLVVLSQRLARGQSDGRNLNENSDYRWSDLLSTVNLPNSEIQELNDFYEATDGDYWSWQPVGAHWNFSANANPCEDDWQGVICTSVLSDGYYHVLGLILSNYSLAGEIPETLVNLPYLEQLILPLNNLYGYIPTSIGNMSTLRTIDLSENFLMGIIPESIFQLTNLSTLALSWNYIYGSLPEALGALQALTTLSLDFNQLSSSLPESLASLTVLTDISMVRNFLSGNLSALCGVPSLQALNFEENFSLRGSIPTCFSTLLDLRSIRLGESSVEGEMPRWLGEAGSPLRLEVLSLPFLSLTGTIPSSVGNLAHLAYLDVSNNRLNGTLPESMNNLGNLTTLLAHSNQLSGRIPSKLLSLPSLLTAGLQANNLEGTIPEIVPSPGGEGANDSSTGGGLRELDLSENRLGGTLPASLCNLTHLQVLHVGRNFLAGSIPLSLCDTLELRVLALEVNDLSGRIHECIGQLPQLSFLKVRDNSLEGSIPQSLGQLRSLVLLDVEGNQLTGRIPESLGNYSSALTSVILRDNYLTGSIPVALLGSQALREIDVGYNALSGEIPPPASPVLASFVLNNNLFHGTLPDNIASLNALWTLVVNDNHLTGTLDAVFNASTQMLLSSVVLSNNQFTGTLPTHAFDLPRLLVFAASVNCFQGTIPPEICTAPGLVSVVLNGLSTSPSCSHRRRLLPGLSSAYVTEQGIHGQVPLCLYNSYIRTLHLSGNQLTGTLPDDALSAGAIFSLSLSHNSLTGSIPAVFQNFWWLKLDLSYNKLSGTLGNELLTAQGVTPIQILYLENNRLSGDFPPVTGNLVNISILGTNLFTCKLDKSDLPRHDPHKSVYRCASNEFDTPYYIWLALVAVTVAGFVIATRRFSDHSSVQLVRSWYVEMTLTAAAPGRSEKRENSSSSSSSSMSNIRIVLQTMDWVCTVSAVCAGYAVLVLLPTYSVLSHLYGTLTYAYAWSVSSAFLSGSSPAGVEMSLWLVLIVIMLGLLYLRQTNAMMLTTTPAGEKSGDKFAMIAFVYIAVNTVIVAAANVAFVYISIYQSSALLVFAQILLAVFKYCWSNYSMDYVLRKCIRCINQGATEDVMSYTALSAAATLVNNLIIPCVVVALASPNCFYNAFVAAEPVVSRFNYEVCADYMCYALTLVSTQSSYTPPFEYTYQCSSSLITYYAPAFLNLCLLCTFASPLAQLVVYRLYQHAKPGTTWFAVLDFNLPRILKPLPPVVATTITAVAATEDRDGRQSECAATTSNTSSNKKPTYFKPHRMFVNIVTLLGLLLTFGVVFPPLAVALAVTVFAVILTSKLKVGRFLCEARANAQLPYYLAVIERECEVVNAPSVMHSSMWMLITISCWFYTLFLFDTLGDAVGFEHAYWVLIVMPLMPVLLCGAYSLCTAWGRLDGGRSASLRDDVIATAAAKTAGEVHRRLRNGKSESGGMEIEIEMHESVNGTHTRNVMHEESGV